jgi:hypothetical protein
MEILSTALPYHSGAQIFVGFGFSLLALLGIIGLIYTVRDRGGLGEYIGLTLFSLAFGTFAAVCFMVPDTPYTTHEVRITDMSKFDTEKYEIIEQRGKIFVVKEITKGDR